MNIILPSLRTRDDRATTPRRLQFLVFLVLVTSLSGCTILKRSESSTDSPPSSTSLPDTPPVSQKLVTAEKIMVEDLLSAIVQILPANDTTVQVSVSDKNELTLSVADALANAGYGIQSVTTDQGSSLLSTEMQSEGSVDTSLIKRLRVNLGLISISRSYRLIADNAIQPVSPFRVYGSRANIDVSSTYFGSNTASTASGTENVAPISIDEPLPVLSLITPEVVQRIVDNTSGSPEPTSLNSAKVEVNNLFYSDTTFGSVLDNRQAIDNLTVIFSNDSIVLGNENKLLVRRFVEDFVEKTDVLSVVGCSNGPTALEIGNVGLALGRAERVTDELERLGIPREKILDEGCWAPRGGVKKFPGRGVVVELFRESL